MRKIGILIVIIIVGCNNEIGLDNIQKRMVVNSAFGTDSIIKIEVIENTPMLSYESVKYIENARVALFENGNFVDYLKYEKDVFYRDSQIPIGILDNYYFLENYKAKAGNEYSLEITCEGYPEVKTSDIIPDKVDIISVDTSWNLVKNHEWSCGHYELDLSIMFKDNLHQSNYYMAEVLTYLYRLYDPYIPDSIIRLKLPSALKCSDPIVDFVLTEYGKYIFSDEAINGEIYEFNLTHYGNHYEGADLYIKLYSISESYYLYLKSYYMQFEAEKDFFAEPVQVFDNIEGGRGIFVGYNVSVDSIYAEWPSCLN